MSKKIFQSTHQNKEQHKESHRPASLVPTILVDAQIHGGSAGSSGDKGRPKASSSSVEVRKGSSQGGSTNTLSKSSPTENRGPGRSVDSATGGSSEKVDGMSAKADSDEMFLDSDLSEDNDSWRKVARNFAMKSSHANLPKMNIPQLKDQADYRQGYQMIKPASMKLWDQVQMMFEISKDHEPSLAHRNAILSRMFPDVHCEFDTTDFVARSMWESFFDQRKEHGRRITSDDESEEEEPQPKKSKAELSKGKTEEHRGSWRSSARSVMDRCVPQLKWKMNFRRS